MKQHTEQYQSRSAMKKRYPDGPTCFYKCDEKGAFIFPGFVFCCAECMGSWLEAQGRPPGTRGNKPWALVRKAPTCARCGNKLWVD